MTTRRKTTMYLDESLLRDVKVAAAREGKTEYQVVEEALRGHLGADVLDRIWAKAKLSESEATKLAVKEVRAVRKAAKSRKTRS